MDSEKIFEQQGMDKFLESALKDIYEGSYETVIIFAASPKEGTNSPDELLRYKHCTEYDLTSAMALIEKSRLRHWLYDFEHDDEEHMTEAELEENEEEEQQ